MMGTWRRAFFAAWLAMVPPAAAAEPEAYVPPANDATEHRLGQRLRCPVCQGMSIGDSPAPMAQDMMRQVRRLRSEGKSEEDIVAYFTARYGDWVLLDPPKQGFALWVWLSPPAALLAGLLLVAARSRRRGVAAAPAVAAADAQDDVYLAAIRQEVGR